MRQSLRLLPGNLEIALEHQLYDIGELNNVVARLIQASKRPASHQDSEVTAFIDNNIMSMY